MKFTEKKSPAIKTRTVKNAKFLLSQNPSKSERLNVHLWIEKRNSRDAVFNARTNLSGGRLIEIRFSVLPLGNQQYGLKFDRRDLRMALNIIQQDADPLVKRHSNKMSINEDRKPFSKDS